MEYETGDYLESQLRTDFINDLFLALGWDITNKANLSPLQREVLVEKGDTKGRPDYSFRMNGEDKFFVEAKAVSKGTDKPDDIFQAKKYGWNTRKVNVVVLTDFKTFKVFDASLKPALNQSNVGLLFELKCSQFATTDFDKLWLFSRDEVFNDSLEKLALRDTASKRLRIPVDTAFLEQMTDWRETLAKDIYKNNPDISIQGLNDVVQRLLDRLVFIRMIEDRKIIESKTLREIVEMWQNAKHRDIQTPLNTLFRKLNEDFNGNIFKPHPCETAVYDSKILAEIINDLYYPKSPYDFKVIGVDLLGVIYEKYLGKTIRLTEKRVKVEEKPEVRKAGGVYYTPKWVVEYIVDVTVGELIKGKKPEDIAKLRVLDPACGSGSFLIGAIEELFQYHLHYYSEHLKEAKHGTLFPHLLIEHDEDGNELRRLSIETKGQILKNNIYGVDIDAQACEITMMSLYIKVLEDEKTLPHNKELLPSLSNNIRCGNSLIEFDFLSQQPLVTDADKEKINPFEWRSKTTGFGNIIGEKDGFDAIIGNPPYIRIQTMKEWSPMEVDYYPQKFKTAASGNYDIYVLFVERAIQLLSDKGLFGFIMPHKFFQAEYGVNLRKLIADGKLLREIVNFTDQQVFDQATTYTHLLFLSKASKKEFKYAEIRKLENPVSQLATIKKNNEYENHTLRLGMLPVTSLTETPWQFGLGADARLLKRLRNIKPLLDQVSENIFVGTQTSADDIFVLEEAKKEGVFFVGFSKSLGREVKVEAAVVKPFLKGREIRKYCHPSATAVLICPYEIQETQFRLLTEKELSSNFPHAYSYLKENKQKLTERERGKMKGDKWYAYGYPKSMTLFHRPKLIVPDYNNSAAFTFDDVGHFYKTGYGIILKKGFPYLFVLGLLNSKLLFKYLLLTGTRLRGGYVRFWTQFIKNLPIKTANTKIEKETEEKICELVKKILELNKKKQTTSDLSKIELLEREANVYEENIDRLVYELYGLTEEEITIVEESVK
jgi:type I restriction-modification system DNA methylase subunit